jgi:hypothetical protein
VEVAMSDTIDRINKLQNTIRRLDTILRLTHNIEIAAETHLAKEEIEWILKELQEDCDPSVFISGIIN